jgi:hypothetical protein
VVAVEPLLMLALVEQAVQVSVAMVEHQQLLELLELR